MFGNFHVLTDDLMRCQISCSPARPRRTPTEEMAVVVSSTTQGGEAAEEGNGKRNATFPSYVIFSLLLVPRLLAAQYSIVGDCDEGALRVGSVPGD